MAHPRSDSESIHSAVERASRAVTNAESDPLILARFSTSAFGLALTRLEKGSGSAILVVVAGLDQRPWIDASRLVDVNEEQRQIGAVARKPHEPPIYHYVLFRYHGLMSVRARIGDSPWVVSSETGDGGWHLLGAVASDADAQFVVEVIDDFMPEWSRFD